MKKILIFQPALAPYRVDFYNQLTNRYNVLLCLLNRNLTSQQFDQQRLLSRLKCDFEHIDRGVTFAGRCFRFEILGVLFRYSPNVVFSFEYSLTTLALIIIRSFLVNKWRLIVMTDDNPRLLMACRGIRRLLRTFVLRHVDGMIVISDEVRRWFVDSGYRADIFVVPIIHDETEILCQIEEIENKSCAYRIRYGLTEKLVVIFVGRFVKTKNIPYLLAEFAASTYQKENVQLVLIGDGAERSEYEKLIMEYGLSDVVLLPGRFEDVDIYAWFRIADVFVLPSIYEAFGAVVNEALILGTYCLVSENVGAGCLLFDEKQGKVFDLKKGSLCRLLDEQYLRTKHNIERKKENLMRVRLSDYVERMQL